MRKIIFILFFFSAGFVFSQASYAKITKEAREIKSSDVGLNIGETKGFSPGKTYSWSIPNIDNKETGEKLLVALEKKLINVGFNISDLKFKESTLFVSATFSTELPSDKFSQACEEVGFTYLILGERIRFINAK
ncbi:MAG: hypothetical protein IPG89_09765 [Bacteroidetes bacterium]|nr:hypothetical protein [Bacteroidota bacterium]